MNTDKFKIFYHPWPHIIFDDFLNYKECEGIIKEILNQPKYDDKVMVNRNRIFKGSKNFKNILSKSPNMKHIYVNLKLLKYLMIYLINLKQGGHSMKKYLHFQIIIVENKKMIFLKIL